MVRPARPLPPNKSSRLPEISASALDTPERVLEFCRRRGYISDNGFLDVEALIESDMNLELRLDNLGDKDASIKEVGGKYIITVNSNHSKSRQRFSMAHEYAHYQLHRSQLNGMQDGEKIMFRDGEANGIESQANRFAASILMPEQFVVHALRQNDSDRVSAAGDLGVSLAAFEYRLLTLGLN